MARAGHIITVEEARELVQVSHRRPFEGDSTVIHITGAHRVPDQVWNTLLKVLEEPPPYVEFHLYAPSVDSLPRTIKSRAHVSREHLPNPQPDDAGRLVRLYESGDAILILREADRYTESGDAARAIESLWTFGAQTGKLDCALLSEYYLSMLRRGASPRVTMKALLIGLAIRHKERITSE